MSECASRTRMILVRHGATEWTEAGRYQGNTSDIPLSTSGRLQARHTAAALEPLRVAAVVCSPFLRAVETAACIAAPHGLFAAPDAAFREVSFGDWEGLTSSEAAARDPGLDERWRNGEAMARPPGGETLHEAAERAIPALEALVARHVGEKVVLVTHSWIVRLVVCHALGVGLSTVARMRCRPGSITIVDVRSGEYVVRLLNATSHLQKPCPKTQ